LIDGEPSKSIVRTQFENHQLRLVVQNPGYASKSAGRRIAAHTSVDHPIVVAEAIKSALKLSRVGFNGLYP
jgi:hypothetical protein